MTMHYRHQQHIPTEIVLAFGERLDKVSLCASLRVCQQWNLALYRLVWCTFTKRQWQHPSYPITLWTKLIGPFRSKDEEITATRMCSYLQCTRSFEWIDIFYPSGRFTPFPNLDLFRRMPNLVCFSLVVTKIAPLEYALLSILTPMNFPNLQELVLRLPARQPTTAINKLYKMFSRLEVLEIRGHWFHGSTSDFEEQTKETWMLKRLTVDNAFIPFLSYCTALELLSMDPSTRGMVPNLQVYLSRNLLRMPNLTVIQIKDVMYRKLVGESENREPQYLALEQLWKKMRTLEDGSKSEEDLIDTLESILNQWF